MIIRKQIFSLVLLVLIISLPACATKNAHSGAFASHVTQVVSVNDAVRLFGEPDAKMVQADGKLRYSWIIYKEVVVDGHDETFYRQPLFGGVYGMEDYDTVYVPARSSKTYCFFNAFVGTEGKILNMTWEGNACDYLLQRNLKGDKMNSLPKKRS